MHPFRTGLRRKLLSVAIANACAATLFVAPAALAQDLTSTQTEESGESTTELPTLQVTESRLYDSLPVPYAGGQVATGGRLGLLGNMDIMDAPFNITSYTSNLIKSQQSRSIADILDNDPSVQTSTRGRGTNTGGDTFQIRGFTLFNSDIALNGLYGVMPTNTISMETVERVEIIKGPNTLLNGVSPGGRVGGTINVIPKRASDTPLTEISAVYQSDSLLGTHIDAGRRFGESNQLGIRFNGVFRDGNTAVDGQSSTLGAASLGFDYQEDNYRLSADLGYQKDKTNAGSGFGSGLQIRQGAEVPSAPNANKQTAQSWEEIENEDTYAALQGEYDLSPNWTLYGGLGGRNNTRYNLRTNHALIDTSNSLASFPVYYPDYSDTRSATSGIRGLVTTGNITHNLNINFSKLTEEGGYLYESSDISLSNLHNVGAIGFPDQFELSRDIPKSFERELTSIAAANVIGLLDDQLLVTLGARHQNVRIENFDTESGNRTSLYDESAIAPAIGITVKPSDNISIYGNYIEGLDLGYTAPATAENAGETFSPSKTQQIEAGIKLDHGDFGGSVSAFEIRQPSTITLPGSTDGAFISTQDGEQRNRGVEINVFGQPTSTLKLLGGIAYLQPTLTETQDGVNDGNQAPGTSRWLGNVSVEWDTPISGLTLNSRVVRSSSQYIDASNTQEIPGWTRWDVGAGYQFENHPITVRANINNLLDKDYWESANGSGGRLRLSEPRSVILSATMEF
ncbi:TonB-dependent receptor [Vreelandella sp. 2A-K22]|uniref:TonB-dependent receptor n=1 Tax=unclassified Halomonas TaxID=2609666 RepID=UPI0004B925EF|nr:MULTISPECIES: TonB-dependent receptor [unclassified Halomonas]NAO96322.1 TonB-dependent siderophore receptor [Halomonas sp. MG34]PKH63781.1 TonB-dependent siderophore receptor [Halomonas sp. Choline-3u-9]QGQ69586.1 TonB-dependent receptor [Halomonas sp. PA16-9]